MKNVTRNRIIWTSLCVLWMAVIFAFSAQTAETSGGSSEQVLLTFVKIFDPGLDSLSQDTLDILHTILRKCAHFFSYTILGILVSHAVKTYGLSRVAKIAIAVAVCLVYAISDEIHQMFIPGRDGNIIDVCIDTAGAIFGIIIFKLFTNKTE